MAGNSGWRQMFDLKHPSLKPLWVRILLIAVCLGWATVELTLGSHAWAAVSAAIGVFMAYTFFFSADRAYFSRSDDQEKDG